MATRTLTPTRALRKPRRIDVRVWVGLLVAIIAALGVFVLLSAASTTRPVLVATHDLPAGAVLKPEDLTVSQALLDDSVYQAAIPASDKSSYVGKQLSDPIHRGQVLAQAQISDKPLLQPDQRVMTVRFDPQTTAIGDIQQGDKVQILRTTDPDKPGSQTSIVLPSVTVYDVGHDKPLGQLNTKQDDRTEQGPITSLSLIVSPQQAVQLANAEHNGVLDVALLPPSS